MHTMAELIAFSDIALHWEVYLYYDKHVDGVFPDWVGDICAAYELEESVPEELRENE